MNSITGLAAVITAARAGSIGYANTLFQSGGWADQIDNPSALATRARLLKDAALMAKGPDRQSLLLAAAEAYRTADSLRPQPYTQINEASMRFLAGDRAGAQALAARLLDWMAEAENLSETPYYIWATRAEAHVLCGDAAAACDAMQRACIADPDGWSDRASTLRQITLILGAMAADARWLDAFRPPVSLNYAGHLGIAVQHSSDVRARIEAWITDHGIGFGFGALAVGADIVMAEAVLATGGALHVVLPVGVEAFIAQSVAPYHPDWLGRFHDCIAAAQSVQCVTSLTRTYEPLATQLAADVAMGATVLHARGLQSTAWQLLVIDDGPGPFGAGLGTRGIGQRWRDRDRQTCMVVPRNAPVPASSLRHSPEGRADRRLSAMLMMSFDGLDACDEGAFADALDTVITPFRAACAAIDQQPDLVLPLGNARLVVFADPDAAWDYARAVLALKPAMPLRLAGHYGLTHWLDHPPSLVGRATADLAAIAASALPGVLTASETLASVLAINRADAMIAEHIGETADNRLFALSPRDQ